MKAYSAEDDARVLKIYEGLRVADVSRSPVVGIAVTARYVPINRQAARLSAAEFPKWEGEWYGTISPEPFVALLLYLATKRRAGSTVK